jgi:hypothetical protein
VGCAVRGVGWGVCLVDEYKYSEIERERERDFPGDLLVSIPKLLVSLENSPILIVFVISILLTSIYAREKDLNL